jgi:hypothetical protein
MEYSATAPSSSRCVDSSPALATRRGVSGISILCGLVITDLYWLYLIFAGHVMNPVRVFVVDLKTGLHLQSGKIGGLATTLDWHEVRLAVLASLIVLVLGTLVVNAAGKALLLRRAAA